MKLLITSIDAIFDKSTNDYFPGIKDVLLYFEGLGHKVLIISSDQRKIMNLSTDFKTLLVGARERQGRDFINKLNEKLNINFEDILILGSKSEDMILAANSKLLFLNADYSKSNNPTDRIFLNHYGIAIYSSERLKHFINHFLNLSKPWYYTLEIDDQTKLYGLTNAMTNKETNQDVRFICERMRGYLKSGLTQYRNEFLIYALMSVYQIFKEVKEIHYWGYYPSSDGKKNIELDTFKEVLRKSFNSSRLTDDILIRHKPSIARKTLTQTQRINNGCDSEFDTIHLNKKFKDKIIGKNVCIIDDFTNHGSSSETVRHLLKEAGVSKIYFITLGKFRTDYKKFNYNLEGDIYTPKYTYTRTVGYDVIEGDRNVLYSEELINSLNNLIN